MKEKIFDTLDTLNISYRVYNHIPVFSCNEAKGIDIPWQRVKSLLIRNKKATNFYMVVLPEDKKLNTNLIREAVSDTKLSFVNEECMLEKIGVAPGSVSPFALIHNTQRDVCVIFDKYLQGKQVGFHPWQNDATVVLDMLDVGHFLEHTGNTYTFLEF